MPLQLLHKQDVPSREGSAQDKNSPDRKQAQRHSFTLSERSVSYVPPFGVEVLCCAYAPDGQTFAVGASDGIVRIYGDDTKVNNRPKIM